MLVILDNTYLLSCCICINGHIAGGDSSSIVGSARLGSASCGFAAKWLQAGACLKWMASGWLSLAALLQI
jgi:hypothetical protein